MRAAGREAALQGHVDRQQLITVAKEQLATVSGPQRLTTAISGNLNASSRLGVASDVDLVATRFVRNVGDPTAVRGEPGASDIEGPLQKRLRLPITIDRHQPDFEKAAI